MTFCPLAQGGDANCYQGDCGWWDPVERQCAMRSIAIAAMEEIRRRER